MAIKGKGKTKSRPAARAPRPVPVVRKPPFFVRRWVQVTAALLAGALAVTVVVWATNGLRSSDAAEARATDEANARRVIQQWKTTVDGALAGVGTAGGLGQFLVLPPLAASVDTLAKGDPDKTANETAATAVQQVEQAIGPLEAVDIAALIRDQGLDETTANYMFNSKARMIEGLRLSGRVAAMVEAATAEDVDPDVAEALIAEAEALLPLAKQVFDAGYTDYTSALGAVGLLQPTAGVPGTSGIPGVDPGAIPGVDPGAIPGVDPGAIPSP